MGLFVEVARARSFRRASAVLGMPSSTLSRRILSLEREIGLRLLHRTTRKIELTEAGQFYFEHSEHIIDEARRVHERLGAFASQPSGVLRVSLPVDFGVVFLAPHLSGFSRRYPGIEFEFDLTSRRVDLVAERVDVAIRMGALPDSQLVARKIAEIPRYLYASSQYLDTYGEPVSPEDLARHECLLFPHETQWTLRRGEAARDVPVSGRFRVNSIGMMQRLSAEGVGIAMLARECVQEAGGQARLHVVLPDWEVPSIAVHAITETRLLPARTQRFVEYLKECLAPRA